MPAASNFKRHLFYTVSIVTFNKLVYLDSLYRAHFIYSKLGNNMNTNLVIIVAVILVAASFGVSPLLLMHQSSNAWIQPDTEPRAEKAPFVVSGNNIYVI
jgi:hypothetical protein